MPSAAGWTGLGVIASARRGIAFLHRRHQQQHINTYIEKIYTYTVALSLQIFVFVCVGFGFPFCLTAVRHPMQFCLRS